MVDTSRSSEGMTIVVTVPGDMAHPSFTRRGILRALARPGVLGILGIHCQAWDCEGGFVARLRFREKFRRQSR